MASLLVERGISPADLGVQPPADMGDVVMAYMAHKARLVAEEREKARDAEVAASLHARLAAS